jgi:uncharacterized damage-inducible protein DinB
MSHVHPHSHPNSTATQIEVARLADQLERSFRGGAWQGPSLLEALAGIDAEAASRRPIAGAHTIGEIAGHAAFWIDAARRRLEGDPVDDVAPEADWAAGEERTADGWRRVLDRLETAHRGLHARVLTLDDERLDGPAAGSDPTVRGLLLGLLQHNAYHAGQIVLLGKAEKGG